MSWRSCPHGGKTNLVWQLTAHVFTVVLWLTNDYTSLTISVNEIGLFITTSVSLL